MKKLLFALLILSLAGLAQAAEKADYIEFHKILDTKCSKCHSRARVDQAMAEKRDMLEIEERMLRHGAELTSREQQVLGIFFRGQEVKDTSTASLKDSPLAEYRSVVQARCTGCHSIDIVEKAMLEKREFDALAKMMIKRGAVLNDKDMKIIQTFWGEPLR